MTQAERIREYYKSHPAASYDEVATAVGTTNSNVRVNVHKDKKAGRCVKLPDGTLDYSISIQLNEEILEFIERKNEMRWEWIDMLTDAARRSTDPNEMRLLIKEANRLMKEVTK
ncbi:hypothetical protein ACERC8_01485 [Streptococcus sp. E29BA]|uniref:hypothetical protein n=1 Tax=Streptococcus sp. E29BA TaxID=3278716 RepID=UPI00359EA754